MYRYFVGRSTGKGPPPPQVSEVGVRGWGRTWDHPRVHISSGWVPSPMSTCRGFCVLPSNELVGSDSCHPRCTVLPPLPLPPRPRTRVEVGHRFLVPVSLFPFLCRTRIVLSRLDTLFRSFSNVTTLLSVLFSKERSLLFLPLGSKFLFWEST